MKIDYSNYYWKNSKILLRLATTDDWEAHYHNYYDSENRFLLDDDIELPPEESRDRDRWAEFVSPQATHGRIPFAVESHQGKVVGFCNLNSIDERHGNFSVGVQINVGERDKGYGTAALRMLGRYAFLERRLHRWDSAYVQSNKASALLHQKLGFVQEGVERECLYHRGQYWDVVHCGLLKDEFMDIEDNLKD